MSHSDNDISLFVSFVNIPVNLGSLFQPIWAATFIKSKVGVNGLAGQEIMPQIICARSDLLIAKRLRRVDAGGLYCG
jgi:hypothetical protein